MNSTIWLALALVLVTEGLGSPMLYPRAWRRMIATLSQLPDNILRRFGGGLGGCWHCYLLHVEENDWLIKSDRFWHILGSKVLYI